MCERILSDHEQIRGLDPTDLWYGALSGSPNALLNLW